MSAHEAGIVEWVNTFNLPTPCSSVKELADGVALSQILLQIAPGLFDMDTIKSDVGDNWALKLNNLKKLVFNLESFYHESLGKDTDFSAPDLSAIAKDQPPEEIKTLVQLLVGAAVSCSGKASYIQDIMQMSSAGQATMQQIVQDAMAGTSGLETGGEGGAGADLEEEWAVRLAEAEAENTQLSTRVDELAREKDQLERTATELREKIHEQEAQASARSARDEQASSLTFNVEQLRAALEEKETALLSMREEVRVSESRRGQESKSRAEAEMELRHLADELDIAQAKAAQAAKAEAMVEKYKRRLEEMSGLKVQLKELEEQNSKYLDQILELESVNKTIPTMKKKIEQYKDQAVELERQKFEATSAVAVKEAEVARLKEELEATAQAKLFFEDELIALRDQQKREGDADQDDGDDIGAVGQGFDGGGGESRAQLREKVARLERDNAMLKARGAGAGDGEGEDTQLSILQSQLEDALRMKDERAADALAAKRTAAELEVQVHKLRQHVGEMEGAPPSAAQVEKTTAKIKQLMEDNDNLKAQKEDRDRLSMTVQSLEDILKEKETQINNLQSDKEKLETYTKKTLHKFQDKYVVALKACKSQLKEKQEKIDHLEAKINLDRAAQKREERLLMSSIYELGMDIIEKRLVTTVSEQIRNPEATGGGASWMQQQREQVRRSNPVGL